MRRIFSALFSLVIIGVIAVGGGLFYGKTLFSNPGPTTAPVEVQLPRGAGLIRIANMLEEEGVISDARIFRLGARFKQAERSLKAGEYEIPPGASMEQVLALLESGDTLKRRVTVPEGLTSVEVVAILDAVAPLSGTVDTPPEGSLAPETYFYERGETRAAVLERMRAAQTRILDELWETRAADLPIETKEQALVLASIVEKETGVASERERVAGVFINRLRKGMRLQSDPTVIYGVTNGERSLGRGITRSDLRDDNPFNTYVINGLPPTPIANPGRDAIAATLNPASTPDFYFVADGTGGHAFSRTLAEHNRNVRKWREIERARDAD